MNKFIDETGNVYGTLVVIKKDIKRSEQNKLTYWICNCSCGVSISVLGYNLRNGNTKSCGCLNKKYNNINIGQKIYSWTVQSYDTETSKLKNKKFWLCKCNCGTIKSIEGHNLKNGHSKSCGCLNKKHKSIDVGDKFGLYTVVKFDEKKLNNKRKYWICKCECGTIKSIVDVSLKSGNTKSCGCSRLKLKDRTNHIFKRLYGSLKSQANNRKLVVKISCEEFKELIFKDCYYCGKIPSNTVNDRYTKTNLNYNGLDRIDNSKGYVIDNIVTCCKTCNMMKRNYSLKIFKEHITRIYKHCIETNKI